MTAALLQQLLRRLVTPQSPPSKMVGKFEHLVFVYGTLKRNQPNNKFMMDTANGLAEFICSARTVKKYPLVIASQFNIPFLLGKEGTGNQITGEVYSVDRRMLDFLDAFEGHPGYYTRLETPVTSTDGYTPSGLHPWLYVLEKYKQEMLSLPMIGTYDSYGDHGLPYVESESTTSLEELDDLVAFIDDQQK